MDGWPGCLYDFKFPSGMIPTIFSRIHKLLHQDAFKSLGEDEVIKVEIVRNKFTDLSSGYALIQFDTDASALMAMHKLNGKLVPNSQPPIRFQLNHSSAQAMGNNLFKEREFSIWVTDLPPDCTDEVLLKTFDTRFNSIVKAKVQQDRSHGGKPYGFVRFTNQEEQRDALIHMNGFRGMGEKPIKVSMAIPKTKMEEQMLGNRAGGKGQYGYYYEQYWADQAAWGNYAKLRGKRGVAEKEEKKMSAREEGRLWEEWLETDSEEEDDERPVPWDVPVNVELMNRQFMERSVEAWAGVERDRWLYCFDTEDSILPDFEKPAPGMKRKVDEEQMFRDLGEESRQGKERKKVKDPAMSKEAARRLSEEEDWETRPEPDPEPEEGDGEAEEASSREEKEAREMEEGYRDFEGEDEQEYQSFVQSLDM